MSPTPATPAVSTASSARGSAGLLQRSTVVLAFAALTFALCVMKALGKEVEYELLIFTASVAGLDSVAGLVRGSVGAIGARLADRRAGGADAEGDAEPGPEPADPAPAYRYEPIPSDLDPPVPWGVLDAADIVVAPHLAVVLYRESLDNAGTVPEPFDALPHEVQASWLDVAHLAAALVRGEPDALAEYLEHLANAAGAYSGEPAEGGEPTPSAEEPAQ